MWNNVQADINRKNIWCCVNERMIERNGVFGYKSEQFFVELCHPYVQNAARR
jgi:hypothetical protein